MTQPYIDTDPDHDVPVDIEGRAQQVGTCHMCGQRGPVFEGAVELADGSGGWTYELGWRCIETGDCRKRRHSPIQPPAPTQPDAKEAPVDWHF